MKTLVQNFLHLFFPSVTEIINKDNWLFVHVLGFGERGVRGFFQGLQKSVRGGGYKPVGGGGGGWGGGVLYM